MNSWVPAQQLLTYTASFKGILPRDYEVKGEMAAQPSVRDGNQWSQFAKTANDGSWFLLRTRDATWIHHARGEGGHFQCFGFPHDPSDTIWMPEGKLAKSPVGPMRTAPSDTPCAFRQDLPKEALMGAPINLADTSIPGWTVRHARFGEITIYYVKNAKSTIDIEIWSGSNGWVNVEYEGKRGTVSTLKQTEWLDR
jgi:hypothetical protein